VASKRKGKGKIEGIERKDIEQKEIKKE